MPDAVQGADSIPGPYLQKGIVEMVEGDFLFEGEANHPQKARGWTYWVYFVDANGELQTHDGTWREFKTALKGVSGRFDPDLLRGAGDLAACVRFAHIQRLGGLERLRAWDQSLEARALIERVRTARFALSEC